MLSNFDTVNTLGLIAVLVVNFYAVYTAFAIRHTFSVGIYRSQALGVGLVATVFAVVLLNNFIFSYFPPSKPTDVAHTNTGPIGAPIYFIFFFVLFYWVDTSVLASRRTDPLLRDTLHWSRVRVVFRPLVIISVLVVPTMFFISEIYAGGTPSAGPPIALAPFITILNVGVPILGIALLPISASRTKDLLLRRQLYWFGLFALFGLLHTITVSSISDSVEALFVHYVFSFVQGYCLYASARSLVPLYDFARDEQPYAPRMKASANGNLARTSSFEG